MPILIIDDIIEEANRLAEEALAVESDENRLAPYNEIDTDDHQRDSDCEAQFMCEAAAAEEAYFKKEKEDAERAKMNRNKCKL